MVARGASAKRSGNVWGRRGRWQPCQAPVPNTPGQEVGGSARAEPVGAAATSLGDGALEEWCFGVLAGDLGVVCEGHAGRGGRCRQ